MDTDNRLKAMRNKITSERLNALGVDRLRFTYVTVKHGLQRRIGSESARMVFLSISFLNTSRGSRKRTRRAAQEGVMHSTKAFSL